jgi:hypothetical protein
VPEERKQRPREQAGPRPPRRWFERVKSSAPSSDTRCGTDGPRIARIDYKRCTDLPLFPFLQQFQDVTSQMLLACSAIRCGKIRTEGAHTGFYLSWVRGSPAYRCSTGARSSSPIITSLPVSSAENYRFAFFRTKRIDFLSG